MKLITRSTLQIVLSLVDGQWGDWGEWSNCPVTCGGGVQKRERKCNNPKPSGGGIGCEGKNEDIKQCNTLNCGRKFLFLFVLSSFLQNRFILLLKASWCYRLRFELRLHKVVSSLNILILQLTFYFLHH